MIKKITIALAALAATGALQAADWSDTALSARFGTAYHEPFNNNTDGSGKNIAKSILAFTHASGYKYGSNFFNVDLLMSDSKDPSGPGASTGAQEVYIVYRNTLDLEKTAGFKLGAPGVRGSGVTVGFDANAKTDAGYNSKKRMIVLGPTVMFDVPGFLNVSLLQLWESNAPCSNFGTPSCVARYSYKPHPMLTAAWSIPVMKSVPLSFEGFANVIASKGKNEFGGSTATETNIDAQLMLDVGAMTGGAKNMFKLGLEYQYWKNKFGNPTTTPGAGNGATASTPMIRAEYHF